MAALHDRIAALERSNSQGLANAYPDFSNLTDEQLDAEIAEMSKSLTDEQLKMLESVVHIPGHPWKFVLDLIDKRVPSLAEREVIGKRVIAGMPLDNDLRLFAELDRFIPSSLLDVGLNAAALFELEASY